LEIRHEKPRRATFMLPDHNNIGRQNAPDLREELERSHAPEEAGGREAI
jgi:hypothetical protein